MNPFNCRQVSMRVALGDLSEASWRERWIVRFHLVYCWFCRKYERQLGVIARAFEAGAKNALAGRTSEALKKRLLETLKS